MGVFRYEAVDTAGKKLIGSMQADNVSHVKQHLQSMGYSPTIVEQATTTAPRVVRPVSSGIRLSRITRGIFYRSLATTLKSGMEIGHALGIVANSSPNPRVKELALGLKAYVDNGTELADAMAAYPGVFEPWQIGAIHSGEIGGFIEEIADQIATEYEQRKWKFEFFCNTLWLSFASNIFIAVLILPLFTIIYKAAASGHTNPMIAYLTELWDHLIPRAILWTVPFVALKIGMITQTNKQWYQKLAHRMPLVSNRHHARAVIDFTNSLDRLLKAGIAPLRSWEAACRSIRSHHYQRAFKKGLAPLMQGRGISEAYQMAGLGDSEVAGLIEAAERSGRISDGLSHIIQVYRFIEEDTTHKLNMIRVVGLITVNILIVGLVLFYMEYSYLNGAFDFVNDLFKN